jgi:hypothetical protein
MIAKIGFGHLKIFSRTVGPILSKVGTNCTNEGQPPTPRVDNSERVKIH